MQIKIGNVLYIGGNSSFHLSPPVQGLESPAIRVGDGLYAGRDGGFVSGHFYGHRTIVLNGFYIGADCENASNLRATLFGLLRIRYNHPIIISTETGDWFTEGVVSNVKADIENLVSGKFQITLLCPDPILYKITDPTDFSSIYQTQNISINSGTGSLTINNVGSVSVPPIFTWSGQIKDFTATNTTTGNEFSIDDLVPGGDTVIDFKKRTIIVDGVCYNSHRSIDSRWWTLVPGENVISFSSSQTIQRSAKMKWAKEARGGI